VGATRCARAADSATRARLVKDMERNLARRNGAAALLITGGRDSTIRGRTLAQVAEARGLPPVEAALAVILAGDAAVASFNMNEKDIETFMTRPWVMTGSDGSGGHPRKYGTFPRKLRMYVREKPLLTLEQAVRKMTGQPAARVGLRDRGVLREGAFADITVFDPARVRDRATFEQPNQYPEGVAYVVVNGQLEVDGGQRTPVNAGRPLRGPGYRRK